MPQDDLNQDNPQITFRHTSKGGNKRLFAKRRFEMIELLPGKQTCPICLGKIHADDNVTIVNKGEHLELIHTECYQEAVGLRRREVLIHQIIADVDSATLQEYVDEAEHQGGYAYWLQFDDADALRADIQQYKDAQT